MKRIILLPALLLSLTVSIFAQSSLLQSGPMLGYNEMREVMLWVQTNAAAKVQIAYWPQAEPSQRLLTEERLTGKADAFTAKLIADEVEPGMKYGYELLINGQPVKLAYPTEFETQPLWQWRTDPPDFKVAIGSCSYINEDPYDRPGRPYGGGYQVFTAIHQQRPHAMVWLGDNIYLREVDWYSRTGILKRYTHTRSLPELQPLLASTHHYAIWDDHDFGPNDSDGSFVHKDKALEAFQLFWGNPTFGLSGQKGITSFFQYMDADFFLLDNRYNRSANGRKFGEKTILGKDQIDWLIDALAFSKAPFKIVCVGGQVLNTVPMHETYINANPEERDYLLRRIEEEGIKNVIFLTGDRHHTELSRYVNAQGNAVYDFTSSPLSSGTPREVTEVNTNRVEGTLVVQRNFGMLEFSGPRTARKLTLRTYDSEGKELWAHEISAEK
jgi:alkaline phosphatase D